MTQTTRALAVVVSEPSTVTDSERGNATQRSFKVIKDILSLPNYIQEIPFGGKSKPPVKYIRLEGWHALAQAGGVALVIDPDKTRKDYAVGADGSNRMMAATVSCHAEKDGKVLARVEGYCDINETENGRVRFQDGHAILSMAQTRAQSKCARAVLGHIVAAADLDYAITPAAEMGGDGELAQISQSVTMPADSVREVPVRDAHTPVPGETNVLLSIDTHDNGEWCSIAAPLLHQMGWNLGDVSDELVREKIVKQLLKLVEDLTIPVLQQKILNYDSYQNKVGLPRTLNHFAGYLETEEPDGDLPQE